MSPRAIEHFFPGIPEGQKRPRVFQNRGRVIAWSPKSAWRSAVFAQALLKRPKVPMDGTLVAALEFVMPCPKSDKKRMGLPHTVKPDADNLSKAVLDALKDAGWFVDDSRISELKIWKFYESQDCPPGCHVTVVEK